MIWYNIGFLRKVPVPCPSEVSRNFSITVYYSDKKKLPKLLYIVAMMGSNFVPWYKVIIFTEGVAVISINFCKI